MRSIPQSVAKLTKHDKPVELTKPQGEDGRPGQEGVTEKNGKGAVDELLEEMKSDAAARDGARAAIYVATVRPEMAGARYIRQQPGERAGGDGNQTHEVFDEGEHSHEAKTRKATNADAVDVEAAVTSTGTDDSKEKRVAPEETTMTAPIMDSGVSSNETGTAISDDEGSKIAKARVARRQARKRAKREQVRRVQARRRQEQGDTRAELQLQEDARRIERQHQAEAAMRQLDERRRKQPAVQQTRDGEVVCVSLVQRQRQNEEAPSGQADAPAEYVEANDGLPTASMEIAGSWREIKLDSCARFTIVGTGWMQYGDKVERSSPVDYVEGIGGFLLDVVGVWRFQMNTVFGEPVTVEACVVDGCTNEFLLGVDFMKAKGAIMDFSKGEVQYQEDERAVVIPFRTYDESGGTRVAVVRVVKKTQLMASAVTPIEISVSAKDGEQGIFLPTRKVGSVMLAATVTTARGGRAWVPALNANSVPARLPNKKELGTWIPLDANMSVLSMSGGLSTPRVKKWLDDLGDSETPLDNEDEVHIGTEDAQERELMLKLLRVYRKVTTSESDCPPATALNIQHHIDTGDAAPVLMKRRRQAQTEDEVVDKNVTNMLGAGVIEEGDGAWGFPVVLVRKKDGEIRFCVDYRALNKITKKDVYPLPRIDETLEALSGALLFSTLDLKAGYWQIMVAPEDRDKTAFLTKKGLYRFVRMPFGLTNAPSTFQRMMNHVLRGLTWSTCLVYLDDIVIFTKGGMERHVVELASVLERLATAGLTLKLRKCRFAMESMEYLGHELSRDGVRPVQRLIAAVQQFPRPADAVEAKRFVHLAGYYRRFVEGFGSMMAPITKLLRKDAKWEWTATQEQAFEAVKAVLTKQPLLLYPDFGLPFRVATDASTIGLGACLMQDHGKGWQPIAFASKVNSEAESKYNITELECLAVVWAIKLFRPYLYGRTFTILTDHAALKWLMTSNNLTGKLHRWAITLQEYEFDVQYRPGTTNVVADALSRAPAKMLAAIGRRQRVGRRPVTTADATAAADTSGPATTKDVEGAAVVGRTAADDAGVPRNATRATGHGTDESTEGTASSWGTTADARTAPTGEELTRVTSREPRDRVSDTTSRAAAPETALGDPMLEISGEPAGGQRQPTWRRPETRASTKPRSASSQSTANPLSTSKPRGNRTSRPQQPESTPDEAAGARDHAPEVGRRQTATQKGLTAAPSASTRSVATTPVTRQEALKRTPAESREVQRYYVERDVGAIASTSRKSRVKPTANGIRTSTTPVTTSAPKRTARLSDEIQSAEVPPALIYGPRALQRAEEGERSVTIEGERRTEEGGRRRDNHTLQLTDDDIRAAQTRSRLVQRLQKDGAYRGMPVTAEFELVTIQTPQGKRVVLPPSLWPLVFKECHDSIWAGHLRAAHTYTRVAQLYWWPNLQREVKMWIRGCQECGSRKARPRDVIPPLRSLRGGDVGDRWALDVAGPLPVSDGGQRYVIAAVEYVTRYAVAVAVEEHTAERVAKFLMQSVVLKFGVFRELLTDGAPELTGKAIEQLVLMLQAEQINPVPYRPQMVGLVERFNRTWKDLVATYMHEDSQNDWDVWVDFAVYAYNSGRHSTVALSPNELMLGRRLRPPNELLRRTSLAEAGELTAYHRRLLAAMKSSHECAERAREREQRRQARYYNRQVRQRRTFEIGDRVWMFRPPRGAKASKFVHSWAGPMRIIDTAGYDNFLIEREDTGGRREQFIAHVSFLVTYHQPAALLETAAADIEAQLEYEGQVEREADVEAAGTVAGTTTAAVHAVMSNRAGKRPRRTVGSKDAWERPSEKLVELRRRRRRNKAGHYVLEYELQPIRPTPGAPNGDKRWVSISEYDALLQDDRVVEDSGFEEGV